MRRYWRAFGWVKGVILRPLSRLSILSTEDETPGNHEQTIWIAWQDEEMEMVGNCVCETTTSRLAFASSLSVGANTNSKPPYKKRTAPTSASLQLTYEREINYGPPLSFVLLLGRVFLASLNILTTGVLLLPVPGMHDRIFACKIKECIWAASSAFVRS